MNWLAKLPMRKPWYRWIQGLPIDCRTGQPNITLYGATDPTLIGCYGQNQHYLTANSMENITSDQVFSALNLLIK